MKLGVVAPFVALVTAAGCGGEPSPSSSTSSPAASAPSAAPSAPASGGAAATPSSPVPPPPEGAVGAPADGRAEVEPSDKPPVPAEDTALAEALKQPDFTGTFVIEAREASSGTTDTCTGDAAMVEREGRLDGLATCSFGGEMADFGTTKGRITLAEADGQAHFDASPSPVIANPEVTREGGGIQLRFGDSLDVGDGHSITYAARIDLSPAPPSDATLEGPPPSDAAPSDAAPAGAAPAGASPSDAAPTKAAPE